MKQNLLLILIPLIFLSCGYNKEVGVRPIKILYKNGNVFCEGNRTVFKKSTSGLSGKEYEKRTGIWKFNYPNGHLEFLEEYDKAGKRLNQKHYSKDGKLIHSIIFNDYDFTAIETRYDKDGNIEWESNDEVIREYSESGYCYAISQNINEYYKNGHLKRQFKAIDGSLEGSYKIWDEDGELVLEIEYLNDLIVLE